MIRVNFFGFALNVLFCSFFYFYTIGPAKNQIWTQIGIGGAISAVGIAYTQYEDPKLIEFRFGMIMMIIILFLIGSPLLGLVRYTPEFS